MSDLFWKQLNYVAGLIAIAVLFTLAIFCSSLEVKDLDLWLHVRTGQYIVENHTIPDHDILSNSLEGKPWQNHEWLFQVVAYTVKANFGYEGLITMQSVVVGLTFFVLVLIAYRGDRQWLIVFTLLLTLLVYQSRFTIRPDIFSLLFFSMYMFVLSHLLHKRWSLIVLGIIQVLWVNMHGFFMFGPLLVLLAIISETIKRRVPLPWEWNTTGRLTDEEYGRLFWMLAVVCGACLINPLGVQGALYPLKILFQTTGADNKIFFKYIYELQRPIGPGGFFAQVHIHYKILIFMSALSFFFNRRKLDISVFFLWIIFLFFSLAAMRNMVFFAAAAYLVIMVNSMTIVAENLLPIRFTAERFKLITGMIAKIGLICWMMNYGLNTAQRGYLDLDTYERKSEYGGVSKRSYPDRAVDFLIANNIKGNFFNDFNSGAYLIGRTFPNIKVYIDGRTEVYGAKFFENYQKVWRQGDRQLFDELVRKYNITGVFLNGAASQNIWPKCLRMIYRQKDWKLVYFDFDAIIFLKNVPENHAVIARHGIDLKKWQPPPMDLQRLGSKRFFPFTNLDRARRLLDLKLYGPAMKELKQALTVDPGAMDTYQMMGDIYAHNKNYQKAFECFRIATTLSSDHHNRLRLAWSYEHLGNDKEALVQYRRFLEVKPDDEKVINKIKKIQERLKKARQAKVSTATVVKEKIKTEKEEQRK